MDDGYSPASILVFVCFILLEAVFYGFGAAVQNVNEEKLEEEAQSGNKKAARLLGVVKEPGRFIHTIQITTHLIGMITGALILPVQAGALMRFVTITRAVPAEGGLWYADPLWWENTAFFVLAAGILLILMISFGIVIPKRLALINPERFSYQVLGPVLMFTALMLPATKFISLLCALILKCFGLELEATDENVTEEEILSMVNEGHEQGVLEAGETEMISNIFELGDKKAGDIMTHRTAVAALEGSMPLKAAVEFILKEGVNTRYPVYGEDIDDIIGILHLRDAMKYAAMGDKGDWQIRHVPGLLREASFIPETRSIGNLLEEMQSKKIHMEIVVDEYGQTAGLLTIEDILEEIVGNIMDEYDEEDDNITKCDDGSFIMSGLTPLDDVADALDLKLSEEDRDAYDTLNGCLVARLDRIPQEGENPEVDINGWRFKVIRAGSKMIESVLVTRAPEEFDGQAGDEAEKGKEARKDDGKAE